MPKRGNTPRTAPLQAAILKRRTKSKRSRRGNRMAPNNDAPLIRVTLDDIRQAVIPETASGPAPSTAREANAAAAPGARVYGNIHAAESAAPVSTEERGSILLQGWFYLGAAGLLGTLIGW